MKTTIGEIAHSVFVGLSKHGRSVALTDDEIRQHQTQGLELHVVPYVTASAIRGNALCLDGLDTVAVSSKQQIDRYCIAAGDVLVVCRGTNSRSTVVPLLASPHAIASSLIAVRLDPAVLRPELLCAYLNEPLVIESLRRQSHSTSDAISFSVKSLQALEVHVIEQSKQDRLCEIYRAAIKHYDQSVEIANEMLSEAHQLINRCMTRR